MHISSMKVLILAVIVVMVFGASPAHAGLKIQDGFDTGSGNNFVGNAATRAGVDEASVPAIVGRGLQGAISLVGIFFLILTIYGGFTWMTARGNEERVTKGRKTVFAALIGAIIVVAAYAITVYIGRVAG